MSLFSNLSIRFKILMIVAGGVAGLVVTQLFAYNTVIENQTMLGNVRNTHLPILTRMDAALVHLEKIKDGYSTAVITEDEDALDEVKDTSKAFRQFLQEVAELENSEQDTVNRILQDFNLYIEVASKLSLGMINESLSPEASQSLLKEMNLWMTSVEEALHRKDDRFAAIIDQANEASSSALFIGMAIAVITALSVAMVGLLIGNSITHNIATVVRSLEEISSGEGDLTSRLKSESNDEIGVLVDRFNTFVDKLHGVIAEVTGSAGRVADSASEMKQLADTSVGGMNSQQQEINMVVTAMAEMTSSVDGVSSGANRAAEAASTVRAEAGDGRRVVEENLQSIAVLASEVERAAEVIQKLENHSESIGQVLNVIRDIAEQTNLLALNAAIEAARAGEQGRGFAVVADEVRTLATRTHESTREINEMIVRLQTGAQNAVQMMSQGREQAQASVNQAARVGESLERITRGITEISDMNVQIADAAEEQSVVAREINSNIVNLKQVVNEVSTDAIGAQQGSQKLEALAAQLRMQVSVFKV